MRSIIGMILDDDLTVGGMNLIDIIFDLFMEAFPQWLSVTIFGTFFERLNNGINNKFLKIVIYSMILLLSIVVAFGLAIVIIGLVAWFLMKLNII